MAEANRAEGDSSAGEEESNISLWSSDEQFREYFDEGLEQTKLKKTLLEEHEKLFARGQLQFTRILESPENRGVMQVKFSDDGKLLSVGYNNGVITIFDKDDKCFIDRLKVVQTKEYPVTSLKFLPCNQEGRGLLVATYASGHTAFWNLSDRLLSSIIPESRPSRETTNCAINQSATRVATVGADPSIIVYDVETKSEINRLNASHAQMVDGHNNRVFAIQFEPGSENVFVTGGWDRTVHFWDCRQQRSYRHIYGPYICGDGIDIEPDTKNILTASWRLEDNLEIWNFGTGTKIVSIPDNGLKSHIYSAQWLGKNRIACAGSNGNIVRIIDSAAWSIMGWASDLPNGIFCMDNDRNFKPKLAFGAGTKVYVAKCQANRVMLD